MPEQITSSDEQRPLLSGEQKSCARPIISRDGATISTSDQEEISNRIMDIVLDKNLLLNEVIEKLPLEKSNKNLTPVELKGQQQNALFDKIVRLKAKKSAWGCRSIFAPCFPSWFKYRNRKDLVNGIRRNRHTQNVLNAYAQELMTELGVSESSQRSRLSTDNSAPKEDFLNALDKLIYFKTMIDEKYDGNYQLWRQEFHGGYKRSNEIKTKIERAVEDLPERPEQTRFTSLKGTVIAIFQESMNGQAQDINSIIACMNAVYKGNFPNIKKDHLKDAVIKYCQDQKLILVPSVRDQALGLYNAIYDAYFVEKDNASDVGFETKRP